MLLQPAPAFASLRRGRRLPLPHLEIISAQSALPAVKFSVVATPNPSLIERKERWARKMAGKVRAHHGEPSTGPAVRAGQADFQAGSRRSTDRLPPGQHLTQGFPILDLGIKPEIALADWRLEIGGLVENPKTFTWEEFNALPQFEDISDFHCVKPKPEVRHVLFSSYDGYTTNVRIEDALDDDTLVATKFDGKPIPRDHGGPARVIIPKLYAWKGAKFVRAIQFVAEDQPGFWEVRGYSNTADPWTEDRFG
jgi:DMSO/TMAO reductase YedYZ molybdopterin-dependent catalytic subunit